MNGTHARRYPAAVVSAWVFFVSVPMEGNDSAFARRFLISTWGTHQGLPQSSVTALAQTLEGYLWMGTFNGLVRYDGVRFRIYNSQNTPGLNSSRIISLLADTQGRLWIGTENEGIHLLENGRFRKWELPADDSECAVRSIVEDRQKRIWVTTTHGLLICFAEAGPQVHLAEWELGNDFANWVAVDREGTLWLATEHGLSRFIDGRFVPVHENVIEVHAMAPALRGGIWVAVPGYIRRFSRDRMEQEMKIDLEELVVSSLVETAEDRLWVGVYGAGLFHWKGAGWSQVSTSHGLSHDRIRALLHDSEQNLWVGTDGGGVNRLRHRLFRVVGRQEGLREEIVLALAGDADDGAVWIGTNGRGLSCFRNEEIRNFGAKEGLPNENIWALLSLSRDELLVGTWGGGLFRYGHGKFESVSHPGVINGIICAMIQARNGAIWLGTQHGLIKLRPGPPEIFGPAGGLPNEDIKALAEDRDGRIWIGTNGGGLACLENGRISAVDVPEPGSKTIWALLAASDGSLWIGTFGGGLIRYKDGQFRRFGGTTGFPPSVICKILEDHQQNLWCSSDDGVYRIPAAEWRHSEPQLTPRYTHFSESDGLPASECSGGFQSAGFVARDGSVWFPTVRGAVSIHPRDFQPDRPPPKPIIEEVVLDGQAMTLEAGRCVIPPGVNRIEVVYTGLSFTKPESVRFRYRLRGFDTQWIEAGAQRRAGYTGVPPGDYEFELMAALSDMPWDHRVAALRLVFQPHFWQTVWFRALAGGGAIALIVMLVRLRYQRKLRAQLAALEQQDALQRERLRISRDIHDDVGARMTEILLLSDLAQRDQSRPDALREHTSRISRCAREVVRNLDAIVWAINPSNDNLDQFVSYIAQYAERYLDLTSIRCRLDLPEEPPHIPLSSEIRHNLFLVVKESLNNTVKHSGAGEVRISLRLAGNLLELQLEDDGRGFDPALLERKGNGLVNMERRVLALGGEFALTTGPGKGTRVQVRLPLPAPRAPLGLYSFRRMQTDRPTKKSVINGDTRPADERE